MILISIVCSILLLLGFYLRIKEKTVGSIRHNYLRWLYWQGIQSNAIKLGLYIKGNRKIQLPYKGNTDLLVNYHLCNREDVKLTYINTPVYNPYYVKPSDGWCKILMNGNYYGWTALTYFNINKNKFNIFSVENFICLSQLYYSESSRILHSLLCWVQQLGRILRHGSIICFMVGFYWATSIWVGFRTSPPCTIFPRYVSFFKGVRKFLTSQLHSFFSAVFQTLCKIQTLYQHSQPLQVGLHISQQHKFTELFEIYKLGNVNNPLFINQCHSTTKQEHI